MARRRAWCFTINNYGDGDIKQLAELTCRYVVYGKEKGESGTPHLQGYMEFVSGKTLASLKKLFPTAHFEVRRGTAKQAADYCKKDGDVYERGEITQQGRRSDLEGLAEVVEDARSLREVARAEPAMFIKFHKGIMAYKSAIMEPRTEPPEVWWLWGPTGIGKSKLAREIAGDDPRWTWAPCLKTWFQGYFGQNTVIFEEFRFEIPFSQMLMILDRYECPVEYKGGAIEFNARRIIITSPWAPTALPAHAANGEDVNQLLRRLTHTLGPQEIRCSNVRKSGGNTDPLLEDTLREYLDAIAL